MSSPGRNGMVVWTALATLVAGVVHAGGGRQASGHDQPALIVDFVAIQADGAPVADLQPSDVEIRLNGRLRKVIALRHVVAVSAAPALPGSGAKAALPPPYATNEGVVVGRNFVLLVDEQSFITGREQLLRDAVEGLLGELAPADRAMVVALPFGGVKTPFTSDPERIRRATAGLVGQGGRGESGSEMAERTRRFLEALDGFLQTQAGRRTPLTVVVFTAGLAAPRRDAPVTLPPGRGEVLVNHFKRIAITAGAARANFYVMQPADIATSAEGWREGIAGTNYLGSDNPLEGIEHLAGATAGVRLPLDATGTASLLRVAKEASAYYVAELQPERDEIVGRSRPLSVRVARPGVTVRARPEITFADTSRRTARALLEDLLVSGDTAADLPLHAAAFTVREAEGRLRVGVVVGPVDAAAAIASVGALLADASGRIVARWLGDDPAGRPLLGAMAAPPGTYRLRVAAIDAAGRAGVVEDMVDARLVAVGPLSLGSLMLGISRGNTIVPQLEFRGEPSAIASFDIYGGAAGLGLAATLELAREVEGPSLVTVPLAFTRADESRVVATATVPIGALPPGEYVLRGVILLQDGKTGRVVRTLKKLPPT